MSQSDNSYVVANLGAPRYTNANGILNSSILNARQSLLNNTVVCKLVKVGVHYCNLQNVFVKCSPGRFNKGQAPETFDDTGSVFQKAFPNQKKQNRLKFRVPHS